MAFSVLAVLFIFLSVAAYGAFGPTASWRSKNQHAQGPEVVLKG